MHHTYHTKSIVLGGYSSSEQNKTLVLLTEDFGLVYARVQSLRALASKLRYSLQDFSLSEVSLVHGKSGWRVVGAKLNTSLSDIFREQRLNLNLCARIFVVLNKLLTGEESNRELFKIINSFIEHIVNNKLEREELRLVEYIVMLRIMYNLGYVANSKDFEILLKDAGFNEDYLLASKNFSKNIVLAINKGLAESHL